MITGKEPLVKIKSRAPYTEKQQNKVYLNPNARCVYDPILQDYVYPDTSEQSLTQNEATARERAMSLAGKIISSTSTTSATTLGMREGETKTDIKVGGMKTSPSTLNLKQIDDVLLYSMQGSDIKRDNETKESTSSSSASFSSTAEDTNVTNTSRPSKMLSAQRLAVAMREAAEGFHGPSQGIGIDAEDSKTFQSASETFLDRNFTTAERRYAEDSPDPAHALAGRWAAKEAVIKALSSLQEEGTFNI